MEPDEPQARDAMAAPHVIQASDASQVLREARVQPGAIQAPDGTREPDAPPMPDAPNPVDERSASWALVWRTR